MDRFFFELFEALPRQGPGNFESTSKALKKLPPMRGDIRILDSGCGTGAQTIALAKLTGGRITAVDNHRPFLEILKRRARAEGLEEKIECVQGDMASLGFPPETFDLAWSEGAAYSVGLETALGHWNQFIKPGGFLVLSELVWFRRNPPEEPVKFFSAEYPGMKYFEDVFVLPEKTGYRLIDYFPLPEEAWLDDFYLPAERKISEMMQKYGGEARDSLKAMLDEIEIFRKYSSSYGYGFYLMCKSRAYRP